MGWQIKSLGETCTLATGGTPSRAKPEYFENGTIKWLVSGDIHQKEIYNCNGKISELGLQNSNARYLPENSVMIALNGQGKTRGSVSLLRTKATCNQSLVSICPNNTSELIPEFLYVNLHGRYEEIRKMTGDDGNDRRGLNMPLIRSIKIPLPPIPEQQRIVAILDQAFADIEKARANAEQNLKNARELFDSYLQQVFSQRGEGWVEETLGQATGGVYTGPFGSLLHKSDYIENGIPLVNPAHITKTGILADKNKSVSLGVLERLSNYVMREGDIVIGRRGEMGRCALVTKKEDGFLCGTGSFFIKSSSRCHGEYLVRFLRSASCKAQLEAIAGGAVMPNLSNKDLSSFALYLPSYERQKELATEIALVAKRTRNLEDVYEAKISSLDELKKSLLQKAFSGELTESKGIAA
jgi:type I restriction enzyme S subunit